MARRITQCGSLLAVFAMSCLPVGCGTSRNSYFNMKSRATVFVKDAKGVERVAVMPFKAPTELIGNAVSDMFVTELMQVDGIEMVERNQLEQFLGESELSLAGLSTSKAIEAGKMAGADAVVVGTVVQYETRAIKSKTYPEVSITARLIDCGSSKVRWSVSLSTRSKSEDTTIAAHSQAVVHEMMAGVYRQWMQMLDK